MESTRSNGKVTKEKFKTTTTQKVKPPTHHKKSMNFNQTTTQAKFKPDLMVLICLVLRT